MFILFFVCKWSPCSLSPHVLSAMAARRTIVFHGVIAATLQDPPHCSAPPLQANFRLPRLSRDVEAVTRPRSPLRAVKEEQDSLGAVCEFVMDPPVEVKVEVDAPVEVGAEANRLCARVSAVQIAAPPNVVISPRGPGRPKGSKSRPRVGPRHDRWAPPEREEARKASARIAATR